MALWIAFASFVVALAALAAVLWQILRAEAQLPLDGLMMQRQVASVDGDHTDVWVTIRLQGPIVAHDVEACIWDGAIIGEVPANRPKMTCESDPMVLLVRVPHGHRTQVGITWTRSAMLFRRAQVAATRREVLGDARTYEDWKWNRFQWRFPWRTAGPRGRWAPVGAGWGASLLRLPPASEPRPIEAVIGPEEHWYLAQSWPEEIPPELAPEWIRPVLDQIAQQREMGDSSEGGDGVEYSI